MGALRHSLFSVHSAKRPRLAGILCCVSFLDHPLPIAFAHRGGAAHGPENSWRAFENAVKLGYAYLETDAQATADGTLVAFHDRTLDRVTDAAGRIAQLPYREVAAARIGGTEPIPLIEDLLTAWPDVRFSIDLKDEPAIRPLIDVLGRTGAWDRVCVMSFSGSRLRAFRALADRPVCMVISPARIGAIRFASSARLPMQARLPISGEGGSGPGWQAGGGGSCAQVPLQVATGPFIRRAHALGLQVHVWTLNAPEEMDRVLDLGADGIMSDEIVILRDVLTRRGQWNPRQGS
jgi:glycerophosphoryl diester phosphodiesterase